MTEEWFKDFEKKTEEELVSTFIDLYRENEQLKKENQDFIFNYSSIKDLTLENENYKKENKTLKEQLEKRELQIRSDCGKPTTDFCSALYYMQKLEKENEELKDRNVEIEKILEKANSELSKESLNCMELSKDNVELKAEISVLLSCSNCPENKGGYICEKEYNDKCLAQKIEYIKELKEENEELKSQITNYQLAENESKEIIDDLKAQVIDIKEDVERERNKQRRLENDFTTDILNNLLNKWS